MPSAALIAGINACREIGRFSVGGSCESAVSSPKLTADNVGIPKRRWIFDTNCLDRPAPIV
jgi:hypothetical protein